MWNGLHVLYTFIECDVAERKVVVFTCQVTQHRVTTGTHKLTITTVEQTTREGRVTMTLELKIA